MKALINIDYTIDFVKDDGKLTAGKNAQVIEDEIIKITKNFHDEGDFIVFAIDDHKENDFYHPEKNFSQLIISMVQRDKNFIAN